MAAFPLAPVFAVINNIIEIRIDAKKFLCQYRRPIAIRASSIGLSYSMLRLSWLSTAFNIACTIAFARLRPDYELINVYFNFFY